MDKLSILKYYENLPYTEQKKLLRSLAVLTKQPPYYIIFDLDSVGIAKMSSAITYCDKNSIPYVPEKRGNTRVAFRFENLSDRNIALIGRLTE